MSTMDYDKFNLTISVLSISAIECFFFFITAFCKFAKIADIAPALGFISVSVMTMCLSKSYGWRQITMTTCICVWAVRLSFYLVYRMSQYKGDDRIKQLKKGCHQVVLFWLFQGIWVFAVSLPIIFVNSPENRGINEDFTYFDGIGFPLFFIGFVIETVSDWQKYRQRSIYKDRWCETGLWRYSRHPNYFGEILLWWGIFIAGCSVFDDIEYAAAVGPSFTTLIILFVSGIPILEKNAAMKYFESAGYTEYKNKTSPLIPFPPTLYAKLRTCVKCMFCCELPLYSLSFGEPNSPVAV